MPFSSLFKQLRTFESFMLFAVLSVILSVTLSVTLSVALMSSDLL